MKEWDRRTNERFGFSDLPGDCLAFKYLRDVSNLCYIFVYLLRRRISNGLGKSDDIHQ